jgi:hypothetical protein
MGGYSVSVCCCSCLLFAVSLLDFVTVLFCLILFAALSGRHNKHTIITMVSTRRSLLNQNNTQSQTMSKILS